MLSVENVGLEFAGEALFEGVTFRIGKRERVGLAGKNGAGKSTLLNILSKHQQPTYGNVVPEGNTSIGFLMQDLDFNDDSNLWDETKKAFSELQIIEKEIARISKELEQREDYESDDYMKLIEDLNHYTEQLTILGSSDTDGQIEKILLGLGFKTEDYQKPTSQFSGGWRMRIELAKLLLQKHDILLLDEPTNHLDIDAILWLEGFLKQHSGAVILVSHDKMFLDQVCNRTIEIANRKIEDYKTNYSKYLILRKERKEKLEQAQKNQDKQIKHTEELINKFRAKASKASTARSLMKKLDRVERIELENEDVSKMNIRFIESKTPGKLVLEMEDIEIGFGKTTVLSKVDMVLERGKKIAFVGQNGQGKTTLAKTIVGKNKHRKGQLTLGHNVELGYFAQNQSEVMDGEKTLLQEAEYAATEETHKLVRDMLGTFLFSGDQVEKKVKVLSGGERNRLALCKLLLRPFNVLVMDEPTNHLDIYSKEILKMALKKFTGTLILVSHDREFLEGLVDIVYEFKEGRVKEFLGGIDEYLESRKVEGFREIEKVENEKPEKKQSSNSGKKQQDKFNKQLEKKIAQKERNITELETKISKLENVFLTKNPEEQELKEYESLKSRLKEEMKLWESLQDG